MSVRERLLAMGEPALQQFNASLLPGVEHIIGIRMPALRQFAREIVRGDWRAYLVDAEDFYHEERVLQGLVIGYARCPIVEKLEYVAQFVPKINNWAVCDTFCWRLKADERAPMWDFIQPYLHSSAEFEVRFAVVMALNNFTDAEHLEAFLQLLGHVRHEGYYARMGVAWAVSICYVRFPARVATWLADCPLDDWTYNKSLQKIRESHRPTAEEKARIGAMKK